jgi:mannose-1-phosphate guanylyltransferase/mannose-6-phosphate isomerase
VMPADGQGNVVRGDVLLEDAHGCYVHADSRLVAVLGIRDTVIVETSDAVLVAPKSKVQDVKKLVARIKAAGRVEHLSRDPPTSPGGTPMASRKGKPQ